jgi:hypothetical protein
MATAVTALVPRRWMALPRRSARLRLTLLYSGMFLMLVPTTIVRAIATAHGGTVAAEPRPDGGLVVTVSLPAASVSAGRAVPHSRPPNP